MEKDKEEAGDTTSCCWLAAMDLSLPNQKYCKQMSAEKDNGEVEMVPSPRTLKKGNTHTQFWGDLSGQNDCLGILSDFSGHTYLKAQSSGKRKIFGVGGTNELKTIEILSHYIANENGLVAFIESTKLCNFPRWSRSNVVAFREKKLDH